MSSPTQQTSFDASLPQECATPVFTTEPNGIDGTQDMTLNLVQQLMARMGELENEVKQVKQVLRESESKALSSAQEVMALKRDLLQVINESFDTRAKVAAMRSAKDARRVVFGTTELVEKILAEVPMKDVVTSAQRINKSISNTIKFSRILQRTLWRVSAKDGGKLPNGTTLADQAYCFPGLWHKVMPSVAQLTVVERLSVHIQGHLVFVPAQRLLRIGVDLDTSRPVDYTQSFIKTRMFSQDPGVNNGTIGFKVRIAYEISRAELSNQERFPATHSTTVQAASGASQHVAINTPPEKCIPKHPAHSARIVAYVFTTASTFGDLLRVAEEIRRGHPKDWPSSLVPQRSLPNTFPVWAPGGMGSLRGTDERAVDLMTSVPTYRLDGETPDVWYRARSVAVKKA